MEHSPSREAKIHSSVKEIVHLLWNPMGHYSVHKRPSLVPLLGQKHPVHIFPPNFLKIHFNIIIWTNEVFKIPKNPFKKYAYSIEACFPSGAAVVCPPPSTMALVSMLTATRQRISSSGHHPDTRNHHLLMLMAPLSSRVDHTPLRHR